MLRHTTILVLVLLSSEIHGSLLETVSVGNEGNSVLSSQTVRVQDASNAGNQGNSVFRSQTVSVQDASNNVGNQHVILEADGTASVFLKIDMRVILERLNMIPDIGNTINLLIQKIDQLIVVVGGNTRPPSSINELIIKLEKLIISRIDQQDTKITAIIQLLERIGSQVGSIIEITTQTLTIVQNIQSGGGAGGKCAEKFGIVERLIQQIMKSLVIIQKQIAAISSGPSGGQLPQILQLVQQNVQIVQQNYQILQQIESGFKGGAGKGNCGELSKGQFQIIQTLQTVISLIEKSTTQIITIIQQNNGGGGVLVYITELIKLVKTILTEIEKLRVIIVERTTSLVTKITEQKQEIVTIKELTTEQTSYARYAARAASRALKCPDGSQPLGDSTHESQPIISGGGRNL